MIDFLGELLGDRLVGRLLRKVDGKQLSDAGTIRSSFKLIVGTQPGVTRNWSTYSTSISERHIWIGRSSAPIASIHRTGSRSPSARERMSVDADAIVISVTTTSAARLEWAFRFSQLDAVIARLGNVKID